MRRVAVAIVVLALLATCARSTPQYHVITYRLSGTSGTARIVEYHDGSQTTLTGDVDFPWEHTVTVPSGVVVQLAARNPLLLGSVICDLLLDSATWQHDEALDYTQTAQCYGTVP